MTIEEIAPFRSKSHFIFEMRYPPLLKLLDSRGAVIENINRHFKDIFNEWRVKADAIEFVDKSEKTTLQVSITHMATSLLQEDARRPSDCLSNVSILLHSLFHLFPSGLSTLTRLGFRSKSVFLCPPAKSFDDVLKRFQRTYLAHPLHITTPITDARVELHHKHGMLHIGPFQKGEKWAKDHFNDPDQNFPDYGIAIDVDSSASKLAIDGQKQCEKALEKVADFTFKMEAEAVSPLVAELPNVLQAAQI